MQTYYWKFVLLFDLELSLQQQLTSKQDVNLIRCFAQIVNNITSLVLLLNHCQV